MVPEEMKTGNTYRVLLNLPDAELRGVFRAKVKDVSQVDKRVFVLFDARSAKKQAEVNGENVTWADVSAEQCEALSMYITTMAIEAVQDYPSHL